MNKCVIDAFQISLRCVSCPVISIHIRLCAHCGWNERYLNKFVFVCSFCLFSSFVHLYIRLIRYFYPNEIVPNSVSKMNISMLFNLFEFCTLWKSKR